MLAPRKEAGRPRETEIEAVRPTAAGPPPRWLTNRGSAGLLEMVLLKMASNPTPQSYLKGEATIFLLMLLVIVSYVIFKI
jgi:hypothetical protein